MKKFILSTFFLLFLIFSPLWMRLLPSPLGEGLGVRSGEVFAQQSKGLDVKFIAANYYKGIVKILLYDSVAAKQGIHSGYVGRGSGFIVTDDGIVFTNRHVIDLCVNGYLDYDYTEASTKTSWRSTAAYSDEKINDPAVTNIRYTGYATPIVQVYYGKGEGEYKLYIAKVLTLGVGSFDGAMLKIISDISGKPVTAKFPTVPIGNSDGAVQGEDLCVYGYPAQYDGGFDLMLKDMSTLTFGKLSGYDYVFNKDYGYIKTDASINSGNSGGPVFGESNKVVGIATATGTKTSIGLIGGINGMYYVAAPKSEVLQKLTAKGLSMPKNAGSINTISGEKKDILSAETLNKTRSSNSNLSKNSSSVNAVASGTTSDYYKNSKVTFHNTISGDGILGETFDSFSILSDGLDYVYVQVSNYGEPLNTSEFIVDVYKKSGGTYSTFVETKNFTVTPEKSAAYFKYFPPSTGDYRLSVYTSSSVFINDGYAKFDPKNKSSAGTENTTSNASAYYSKSKINFTSDADKVLDSQSYFTEFTISKEGGYIYTVIDNAPNPLNTDQVIVDIWEKKGGKYETFVETKRYNVTSTYDYTYFKYSFFEPGEYKISVFSKDEVWINTGYVTVKKK